MGGMVQDDYDTQLQDMSTSSQMPGIVREERRAAKIARMKLRLWQLFLHALRIVVSNKSNTIGAW